MINTGQAHQVTGTALANTEFGIRTVGRPTTTTVETAPTPAHSHRRAGHARRTDPAEGARPLRVWSNRFVSIRAVSRSRSPGLERLRCVPTGEASYPAKEASHRCPVWLVAWSTTRSYTPKGISEPVVNPPPPGGRSTGADVDREPSHANGRLPLPREHGDGHDTRRLSTRRSTRSAHVSIRNRWRSMDSVKPRSAR